MKPISCNQEMGDTERLLCPGAPQGPARVSGLRVQKSRDEREVEGSRAVYSN